MDGPLRLTKHTRQDALAKISHWDDEKISYAYEIILHIDRNTHKTPNASSTGRANASYYIAYNNEHEKT